MTGGGYRLLASANFGELVLGGIEAKFCKENTRWKALAEIYTMHSFAPFLESIIENWGKKTWPLISKFSLKIADFFADFLHFLQELFNIS